MAIWQRREQSDASTIGGDKRHDLARCPFPPGQPPSPHYRQEEGCTHSSDSRRALTTTDTDDRLMASAAIMGESVTPHSG